MDPHREVRASCARSLSLYAPQHRTPAAALARWTASSIEADIYGDGGVVRAVEDRVAALLGKAAAVFMPSGTMAQQIALRVHADRRLSRRVVFHPLCHLERGEERAFEHLHGLVGCPTGAEDRLLRLADLRSVSGPLAALVLELPQRRIGAQVPSWSDLVAQTAWARDHGAAVHLDGARLWEAQPFYARPHAQIAGLFDTVYVSFYKGLGGIGGCALAGPEEDIEQARLWRTRHGGLLFSMWPYAADAMHGLTVELPAMSERFDHARSLAVELAARPGIEILPDPPQTLIFNILIDRSPAEMEKARARIAEQDGVWMFDRMWPTGSPEQTRIEFAVGRQVADFTDREIVALVDGLRVIDG